MQLSGATVPREDLRPTQKVPAADFRGDKNLSSIAFVFVLRVRMMFEWKKRPAADLKNNKPCKGKCVCVFHHIHWEKRPRPISEATDQSNMYLHEIGLTVTTSTDCSMALVNFDSKCLLCNLADPALLNSMHVSRANYSKDSLACRRQVDNFGRHDFVPFDHELGHALEVN